MKLRDAADMVRSRNAGAFLLTFDILFDHEADYTRTRDAGVINPRLFQQLYGADPAAVRITPYDLVRAFKVTIPRRTSGGSPEDTDVDGAQQFVPLLDLEIPD